MKHALTEIIDANGVAVLDGALATELEKRGARLDDPLWSAQVLLEQPELIRQVHYDYLRAGVDIITTSSYQATFNGFRKRGIDEADAKRFLQLSVDLAIDARKQFLEEASPTEVVPLIAASIGPYGAYLADGSEYTGKYEVSDAFLSSFHAERMDLLAGSGADLLALETIPSRQEAEVLLELLEDFPQVSAWISFTCKDDYYISDGTEVEEVFRLVDQSDRIIAAGVNCLNPLLVEPILGRIRPITDKFLIVYPNNGEQWDARNRCWLPSEQPIDFPALTQKWYRAGARIIGGCCRTTPNDMAALKNRLYA